jgi:hypothetical protein
MSVCVAGLQVWVDSYGVVEREASESLFPAVDAGSFDEVVMA